MQIFDRATAYWVDNHANIISVPVGKIHADVSKAKLGEVNPYRVGWVRVAVDGNYGVMFDYSRYPSPQQVLSLRQIADEHSMPLFDTIKRQVVEHRANSVIDQLLEATGN